MPTHTSDDYSIFRFGPSSFEKTLQYESLRSKTPIVDFHSVFDFPGWDGAEEWILKLTEKTGSRRILEVGSGANPTLSAETVSAWGLDYTANDVSADELTKADKAFSPWVCDLTQPGMPAHMKGRFDLVFSRMVNEHVANAERYHANIYDLLKPGGVAAHCFSTLYSLPFLVNRILPDSLSSALLWAIRPRDSHKQGKFRAYYSWSRGPSRRMISRYERLGYDVVEYRGYFGHSYYARLGPLHVLESLKARCLMAYPIPALCSYGTLILRK